MGKRVEELVARLQKGARKTEEMLDGLTEEQRHLVLYPGPPTWTVRDMLAHLLSAEKRLLLLAQDIAGGGAGAPEGFDYDSFNAGEQVRLAGVSWEGLSVDLAAARQATIAWVQNLEDVSLDRVGRHPALGLITLADHINAIYGHQLTHMRDLQALLRTR